MHTRRGKKHRGIIFGEQGFSFYLDMALTGKKSYVF
jgi:hypothetical protein